MIVLVLPWNQQSTKTLIMAATGDVIGLAAMSAIDVCSDGNITNSLMSDLVAYRIIASETAKDDGEKVKNMSWRRLITT